ncbi:MAG: hypothetical protein ACFB22_14360 [Rhodothalassiaceae bacterium]
MSETPLLALPLIEVAQAQKEVTHNEALIRLDFLVTGRVESMHQAAPPMDAIPGPGLDRGIRGLRGMGRAGWGNRLLRYGGVALSHAGRGAGAMAG